MKIDYEGVLFDIDIRDPYHRRLLRRRLKKVIGPLIGRPYVRDDYLELAFQVASRTSAPIVVDVGCNIGETALPIAKNFPQATVVAIEAHPVAAARFVRNTRLNRLGNVKLVAAAIAPRAEPVRIFTCPTNSGGHRLTGFAGRTDLPQPQADDDLTVPGIRLDSLFRHLHIEACSILKIDVEGFEWQVLSSLGDSLVPERIPHVVCEYGPEGMRAAGHEGSDMVGLMQRAGYRCTDLHTGRRIDGPDDIPKLPDFHVTDFLFTTAGLAPHRGECATGALGTPATDMQPVP